MSAEREIRRILIFDDDPDLRNLVSVYLSKLFPGVEVEEYDPLEAGEPEQNFDWAKYDVLILDYFLCIHGVTGLDILHRNRKNPDFPATIMLTGAGNEEVAVRALKAGVYDYLRKQSLNKQELHDSVVKAFKAHGESHLRKQEATQQGQAFNKSLFYQQLEFSKDLPGYRDRVLMLIELDHHRNIAEREGVILRDNIIRHIAKQSFDVFQLGECNPSVTRLGDAGTALLIDMPDSRKNLEYNLKGLLKHLSQSPYKFNDKKLKFSVSIGVLQLTGEGETKDTVLEKVKNACVTAAEIDGNSFYIYGSFSETLSMSKAELAAYAAEQEAEMLAKKAEATPDMPTAPEPESEPEFDLTPVVPEAPKPPEPVEVPPPPPVLKPEPAPTPVVQEAPKPEPVKVPTPKQKPVSAPIPAAPEAPELELTPVEPEPAKAPPPPPKQAPEPAPTPAKAEAPELELTPVEPEVPKPVPAKAAPPPPKQAAKPAPAPVKAEAPKSEPAKAPATPPKKAAKPAPAPLKAEAPKPQPVKAPAPPPKQAAKPVPVPAKAEAPKLEPVKAPAPPPKQAAKPVPVPAKAEAPKPEPVKAPAPPPKQEPVKSPPPVTPAAKPAATPRAAEPVESKPKKSLEELKAEMEKAKLPESQDANVEQVPETATETSEATHLSADEVELEGSNLDDVEKQLKKAFDEQRVIRAYQPVISLLNEEMDNDEEIHSISLQQLNEDGSIKLEDEIRAELTTPEFKKFVDHWLLREIIGNLSHTQKTTDSFILKISDASLADAGFFTWLRKLLTGLDTLNPGKYIVLQISSKDLASLEKQASALISYLRKSHDFKFILAEVSNADEIIQYTSRIKFDMIRCNHTIISELQAMGIESGETSENDENSPHSQLDLIKSQGVRFIADSIENATALTEAITSGVEYAMGDFIGEPVTQLDDLTNIESFEIV